MTRISRRPAPKEPMPVNLLQELVRYDPATGEFWWLPRREHHFVTKRHKDLLTGMRAWNTKYAGKRVWTETDHKGYQRLNLMRKRFLAHRAAFAIANGRWPKGDIDHINGQRSDNRLANLREVTHSENCRNRHVPTVSKAGLPGIYWNDRYGTWAVTIGIGGVNKRLGSFKDVNDAIDARLRAEVDLGYAASHCRNFTGIVPPSSPSPAIPAAGEHLGAGLHGSASFSVAPRGHVTGDRDGAGNARPAPMGVNAAPAGAEASIAAKVGNVAPSFLGAPA